MCGQSSKLFVAERMCRDAREVLYDELQRLARITCVSKACPSYRETSFIELAAGESSCNVRQRHFKVLTFVPLNTVHVTSAPRGRPERGVEF